MPKISVIVPVYNTEQYLRQCVDSILCQTFSDFELILVDDGSTDSSGIICDEFAKNDPRVIILHQENRGQAAARNTAVKMSRTDLIAFVDSDDMIHPQYFARLYKNIIADENISCCGVIESEIKPNWSESNSDESASIYKIDEVFLTGNKVNDYIGQTAWAKLIRKEILLEYPFTEGRVFEDNAVVKKWLYAAGKIAVLIEPLYFYRINSTGTSKGNFNAEKVRDVLWSRDEIINYYKEKGLYIAYKQAAADYIRFAINLYYKLRKIDKANAAILKQDILKRYEEYRHSIPFSKADNRFVLELKHPRLMWLYWKMNAIIKRKD
ncbi:MAG: glycosyltransferase family 2 protein [Solobacterium sp.]|nr:glycosyltransferase family 2 protein [Solobacterium sp.]